MVVIVPSYEYHHCYSHSEPGAIKFGRASAPQAPTFLWPYVKSLPAAKIAKTAINFSLCVAIVLTPFGRKRKDNHPSSTCRVLYGLLALNLIRMKSPVPQALSEI